MTDRTRLQVFIPTTTAEGLGLSRAQTVDLILGQYLTRQGILTETEWPKPTPPASTQRPITLPGRLVDWLQSQPGNMSDATRHAIAQGINIEQQGGKMYQPPPSWATDPGDG